MNSFIPNRHLTSPPSLIAMSPDWDRRPSLCFQMYLRHMRPTCSCKANTVVSDIRATAGPLLSLAAVWFGRRAAAAIVLVSFHDAQTFICVEATGSQSDERGLAAVRSGRIQSAGGFLLLLLEVVVVFSRLCFHENTLWCSACEGIVTEEKKSSGEEQSGFLTH